MEASFQRGGRKEPEEQEVGCGVVYASGVRGYAHEISPKKDYLKMS